MKQANRVTSAAREAFERVASCYTPQVGPLVWLDAAFRLERVVARELLRSGQPMRADERHALCIQAFGAP